MRLVRFFEDPFGPKNVNDGIRLMVGIMDFDEDPRVDGGRREAVRVATLADAQEFSAAYNEYYQSFEPAEEAAAEARQPIVPGQPEPAEEAAAEARQPIVPGQPEPAEDA
jgi:hypothetical protein